jgi:hypothetical protein
VVLCEQLQGLRVADDAFDDVHRLTGGRGQDVEVETLPRDRRDADELNLVGWQ